MKTRSGLNLYTALALATIFAMASTAPAVAQTGAEYPRTMPGGGYGGSSIGGGSIGAPAPSGSGPSKTTVIPYDGPDEPTPVTTTHHRAVVHRPKSDPVDRSTIEPAQGHLKLIKNSFAYERPTSSR